MMRARRPARNWFGLGTAAMLALACVGTAPPFPPHAGAAEPMWGVVVPAISDIALAASPVSGATPLTVGFSASIASTSVPCGHYPGYAIDFGDGAVAPAGATLDSCAGPIWSHVYTAAGTFTARLIGPDGGTVATATITVMPGRAVTTFAAAPTAGRAPLTVRFKITGEGSYHLDFGDGQSAELALCADPATCQPATVAHTYAAGSYTASLRTTDGGAVGGYIIAVEP